MSVKDFCHVCGYLVVIVHEEIQGRKEIKLCKPCLDSKTKLADSFIDLFGGKKPVENQAELERKTMPLPSNDVLWARAVRRAFRVGFVLGLIVASFAAWAAIYLWFNGPQILK